MDEKKAMHSRKARGGRLARRAKSFKEDFLGRLNQMRSQSGTRASSPSKGLKKGSKVIPTDLLQGNMNLKRSGMDVDSVLHSVRLLSSSLRYFQDVVQKNTLEMLPGSATVVLETIINIHSCLREALFDEQSSLMLSATNQVYQSLANLIKWSDCVLLHGERAKEKEDVSLIIQALQDAIKTLVQLSIDKLQNKGAQSPSNVENQVGKLVAPKPESPHRKSLPDIPLTPREREILEQTQFHWPYTCQLLMHHSASSDSILENGSSQCLDSSRPPPKPPLPSFRDASLSQNIDDCAMYGTNLIDCAPPLPPKKKRSHTKHLPFNQISFSSDSDLFDQSAIFNCESVCLNILERTSPFSQSPETSTPLSKSSASSLDSNLDCLTDDKVTTQTRHQFTNHSCCESSVMRRYLSDSSEIFSSEFASCATKTVNEVSSMTLSVKESVSEIDAIVERINCLTSSSSTSITDTISKNSQPPALPTKQKGTRSRALSQYDNVPQLLVSDLGDCHTIHREVDTNPLCPLSFNPHSWLTNNHDPSCPHHKLPSISIEVGKPPPLPPKKKTVMAYMQMFGSYTQPSEAEFLRHSLHTYNFFQTNWQQTELSLLQQRSFSTSFISSSEDSLFSDNHCQHISLKKSNMKDDCQTAGAPPALPPKKSRNTTNLCHTIPLHWSPEFPESANLSPQSPCISDSEEKVQTLTGIDGEVQIEADDLGALEEPDVSHYIIFKNSGEEGPDIRGGTIDALIVQATKANKNDFLYQEAFLTTYRTFITPLDLVKKLLYRYNKFIHMSDMRQRAARNAFALLVRVVDDMCMADIQVDILTVLMDFIFQLVSRGELILARALRKKVVEKCEARQKYLLNAPVLLPSMAISTRQSCLLDFKSESLAEQMTLLDADLFQKIEIPEVLLWAKEQKEELSPNLTKFTEHFNKMSYWARSRILEQEEAKDREKYVVKFIKMMKYLRKLNNFNSYLAILSALDSAPIRRLEWQRNITEGLKEYCALIDSSSSFRAYRQALAETSPPCIPYIGLILQDLTFVHIGNSEWFSEGGVNFSKRWQQFNILDNMRRFKNSQYPFRRSDEIIAFFNNFDDYLCEEAMWQISETIKPRGGKKKGVEQL